MTWNPATVNCKVKVAVSGELAPPGTMLTPWIVCVSCINTADDRFIPRTVKVAGVLDQLTLVGVIFVIKGWTFGTGATVKVDMVDECELVTVNVSAPVTAPP